MIKIKTAFSFTGLVLLFSVLLSEPLASPALALETRASSQIQDDREQIYQSILNADDPAAAIHAHVIRVTKLNSHAQTDLERFDARLNELVATSPAKRANQPDLFEDPSYARLLAARVLREHVVHGLEYAETRARESGKERLASSIAEGLKFAEKEPLRSERDAEVAREIDELTPYIEREIIRPKFQNPMFAENAPARKIEPSPGESGFISGQEYKEGRYSLSFDDGPSSQYTMPILRNLRAYGFKAAFMWLAENAPRYPDLVNAAEKFRMVLANHSYTHALLTKADPAQLTSEIIASKDVLAKTYGFSPKLYRCPYGACGPDGSNVRSLIAKERMIEVFWNIDSLDWQDKDPLTVVDRVRKQMEVRKRGIILFHDIHPQSVIASKHLMADLRTGVKNGTIRVLTVKAAIEELNSTGGMQ